MADYFEKVLTDGWRNLDVEDYEIGSENFPGYDGPEWRIAKFALRGGKQQGVSLVEIDNGQMTVLVVPTRGMAVLEAFTGEMTLGWSSPVRQVVHPAYVEEQAGGGIGWLAGFNELICRCGLSYNGVPGEDVIPGVAGQETRMMLPLHGTIANTPAVRLLVRVQLEEPYELSVTGELRDTQMFGPSLGLTSTLATLPGASQFAIRDVVRNLCATPAEMELLYHCNYGPPLLGEGARALVPARLAVPRDARAAEDMDSWDLYGPPQAGFAEQCYFLRLHADEEGRTAVALVDPEEQNAATIRFSVDELPAFTIWKNTGAEPDGYVTGLEPGTDYPNHRGFERAQARVIGLEPEGTHEATLVFGLVSGADAVSALKEEVAALAEGREQDVRAEPDPAYCPSAS